MAQLTKGIALEWSKDGSTSWKKIPDITSIPVLLGEPSAHDVTTIYSTQKEYLEGLPDNGGTLGFGCLFTPELLTEVTSIQGQQASGSVYFRVTTPAPLNKAYKWQGTLVTPANEEWAPDAPLTGTLNITPATAIEFTTAE